MLVPCVAAQDAEWFEAKQTKRGGRANGVPAAPSAPRLEEPEPEEVFEVRCMQLRPVMSQAGVSKSA